MKKQIALAAAAVFITGLFAGFAQAGPGRPGSHGPGHHPPHHHHHNKVLEGVVIGAGAILLGTAIAQGLNRPGQPARLHAVPVPPRPCPPANYYPAVPDGHWEIKKIWVAPVYETRWNPAHYDASGRWIRGRHQQFLVADGYWKNKRVWVQHPVTY